MVATSQKAREMHARDLEQQGADLRKSVWKELLVLRQSVSGEIKVPTSGKKSAQGVFIIRNKRARITKPK